MSVFTLDRPVLTEDEQYEHLAQRYHPAVAAVLAYDLANKGWVSRLIEERHRRAVAKGTSWTELASWERTA